jgi:hypothetical protein
MTPNESALRLYNRAMEASEAGRPDSVVSFFAGMAVAAHGMIPTPTLDERYHMGRAAELAKDLTTMRAQADTMLAEKNTDLLGLVLAGRGARMAGDTANEKTFGMLLLKVVDRELATNNQDYNQHRAEIDRAVNEAKAMK